MYVTPGSSYNVCKLNYLALEVAASWQQPVTGTQMLLLFPILFAL